MMGDPIWVSQNLADVDPAVLKYGIILLINLLRKNDQQLSPNEIPVKAKDNKIGVDKRMYMKYFGPKTVRPDDF